MSKDTEHTPMSFEILPATPRDVSDIAVIFYHCFYAGPDPLWTNYDVPLDVFIAERILEFIDFFEIRRLQFFKAVDTSTGALAGFALFEFPLTGEEARSKAEQSLQPHGHLLLAKGEIPLWIPQEKLQFLQRATLQPPLYDDDSDYHDDSDSDSDCDDDDCDDDDCDCDDDDVFDKQGSLGMEALNRCFNMEHDFYVKYLAVLPRYRRLGLGARLMRAGLKIADERKAKVCLMATLMAKPLYLDLGFKVSEELVFEEYTDIYMFRESEGKSEIPCSAICEDSENQKPSTSTTKLATTSFNILPATPKDIPEIVSICLESFSSTDAVFQLNSYNVPPDVLLAREIQQEIDGIHDQWTETFKAVDTTTGVIAGICTFDFPLDGQPARSVEEQWLRDEEERLAGNSQIVARVPPEKLRFSERTPLQLDAHRKGNAAVERWFCWEEHFIVQCLAVRPCYRKRGLGARLLQTGLDIADERQATVFVAAAPMGVPVYLKQGFEVVEQVEIDCGKFGFDTETSMIRKPKRQTIQDASEE